MPFHPTLCDIDAVGDNSSAVCICLLKQHIANLPQEAFAKIDNSDDGLFYATSRFVKHIDDVALQAFYLCAETLTADGIVFDLMSSWVSHLPQSFTGSVVGHGMNAEELSANLSFRSYFCGL